LPVTFVVGGAGIGLALHPKTRRLGVALLAALALGSLALVH
jgi:hypothetical protein